MSRTPEEREAARRERERLRAEREGRPLPPEPAPVPAPTPAERRSPAPGGPEHVGHPPEPVLAAPAAPLADQPRSDHRDVDQPREVAHDPQATQMFDVTTQWTGEHAAVSERAPLQAPEREPAFEPARPAPALASEPEVPLGTRRVARHERNAANGGRRGRRAAKPPASPRGAGPRGMGVSGPRWRRRIGALLAIAVVAVAGWFLWSIYQPGTGSGSGSVVVTIPRGAGVSEIGDLLASRGVVDSSFFFRLRAKLSGSGGALKSGTFTLRDGMSYAAALDALSHDPPPPPVVKITIPEGMSRGQIAVLARQDGLRGDYLAASRDVPAFNLSRYGAPKGATLEGFLFPATYELKRGATVQQLVRQQLLAFQQRIAQVNLRYAKSKNLTVFDVVTIASMVEREVEVPRERPLVAAVVYNRLKQGTPLGIDATLRFALDDWTRPLTVSQLANPTPYNTRTHQGLPPGPIGNPGLASLQAAAHPANVPYLFYVVKPGTCGQLAFSTTDAQFQQDVQRYDDARNAAGGKSPTKC